MPLETIIDHLRGENDQATPKPTSTRPHAWARWIAAQRPTPAEYMEFEHELHQMREEQDDTVENKDAPAA